MLSHEGSLGECALGGTARLLSAAQQGSGEPQTGGREALALKNSRSPSWWGVAGIEQAPQSCTPVWSGFAVEASARISHTGPKCHDPAGPAQRFSAWPTPHTAFSLRPEPLTGALGGWSPLPGGYYVPLRKQGAFPDHPVRSKSLFLDKSTPCRATVGLPCPRAWTFCTVPSADVYSARSLPSSSVLT